MEHTFKTLKINISHTMLGSNEATIVMNDPAFSYIASMSIGNLDNAPAFKRKFPDSRQTFPQIAFEAGILKMMSHLSINIVNNEGQYCDASFGLADKYWIRINTIEKTIMIIERIPGSLDGDYTVINYME